MGQRLHARSSDSGTTRRTYLQAAGASGVIALPVGPTRTEKQQTITLGGSMSLTGDNANLGRLYRDAYELTIRRINEAGGVDAGDGTTYRLELILRDDGSDACRSTAIYRDLVDNQQVDYLLGPYSSTVALAASEVAASSQKPMVQGSGASPEIFSRGNEWVFGLLPAADTYSVSTIEMAMAQDQPPATAALLTELDSFSQSSAGGAREKLADAGVEVVVDQTFPSETSDLSSLLAEVRDSGAELLVLSAHERHAILLANQLERQNVSPKLVTTTVGSLTSNFREQTSENGDYVYGPSPWNDTADYGDPVYGSTDSFIAAIERAYGYRPDYHSAAGAAVIVTFQHAFQQVTELTPRNVRDAVRQTEITTAYGDVSFDERGIISRAMFVYQWQPRDGGEAVKVLVWPEAVQQSPPIYPMPGR
ncbi:amino acid ABC transporter substrate-binding protein [Haloarchaeobius sp. HRN-SO-5]|uniref:amino acid ABC transporter substrate-binding protein n=1 Tax=Haloarchaeobius sp. HRN-SO-5 TaxID=3446118 RepID=UPI003EB983D6